MQHLMTIKLFDEETACGPYRIEVIMDEPAIAYGAFSAVDSIMTKMLEDLESNMGKSAMENIKIVAELIDVEEGRWGGLVKISPITVKKTISWQEYRTAMDKEEDGEDDR